MWRFVMKKNKKTIVEKLNSPFAKALRDLLDGINSPLGRKVSQKELADAVGVSRQVISQYCIGETSPNVERLYDIAKFFDVSSDFLIGLTSIPTTNTDDRMIHEKTGLSNKAINELKRLHNKIGTHNLLLSNTSIPEEHSMLWVGSEKEMEEHAIINLLLSDSKGKALLSWLAEYVYADYVLDEKSKKTSIDLYNRRGGYNREFKIEHFKSVLFIRIQEILFEINKEINRKEENQNGNHNTQKE